jgi:peptide/nickel transport system substrate-binding protein
MHTPHRPIRRRHFVQAVAAAPLVIAGKGARAQSRREIVMAIPGDPRSLDPMFRDGGIEASIQRQYLDTLVHRDGDNRMRMWLAESVEQQDATTWRVRMKPGIRFSNGEPVDAEAVRYSIQRIVAPDSRSVIRSQIAPLGEVVIEDSLNFTFRLQKPDPLLLTRLTWLFIVPPKHAAAVGDQFTNQPIGSGPYLVKGWRRNAEVAFTANPSFWGTKPHFQDATYKVVPEEIARVSALRTDEAQIATVLSANQAANLRWAPGLKVVSQPTALVATLNFNPRVAPADRIEFRRAVAFAINRDEILRGLVRDMGAPVTTLFGPSVQSVPAGIAMDFPFRLEEARATIERLGLRGAEVEVGGPSGRFPYDRDIASVVAAQLRRVGLNARTRVAEFGTYWADIRAGRSAPVFIQVHGNSWFDPVPQLDAFYYSEGLGSPWRDPDTDALLARTYGSTGAERLAAIGAVMERVRDQVMGVPLFNYTYLHGAATGVDWRPRADDFLFAFELRET